jgi:hypothetical protein
LKLHDSVQIVGFNDPGDGERGEVTFRLFSNTTCTTAVGTEGSIAISATGTAQTSTGVEVTASGTYYWKVEYSGDKFNAPSATSCGGANDEYTTATIHN